MAFKKHDILEREDAFALLNFRKDGLVTAAVVKKLKLPIYQRVVVRSSEIPDGFSYLKKNEFGFPIYTNQPSNLKSFTELVRRGIKLSDDDRNSPVAFYYKKGLRGYVPLYEFIQSN